MSEEKLPDLGKIHPAFFDRVIYPKLGAPSGDIVIGPRHGVDYGVLRVGGKLPGFLDRPLFHRPVARIRQGGLVRLPYRPLRRRRFGADTPLLDHRPQPAAGDEGIRARGDVGIPSTSRPVKYGISVVTGHTARYTGCRYPMVGGATSVAVGGKRDLRGPSRVRKGDRIVVTKGPAIETTGLLAVAFSGKVRRRGRGGVPEGGGRRLLPDVGHGGLRRGQEVPGRSRHARRHGMRRLGRTLRDGPGRRLRTPGRGRGHPRPAGHPSRPPSSSASIRSPRSARARFSPWWTGRTSGG